LIFSRSNKTFDFLRHFVAGKNQYEKIHYKCCKSVIGLTKTACNVYNKIINGEVSYSFMYNVNNAVSRAHKCIPLAAYICIKCIYTILLFIQSFSIQKLIHTYMFIVENQLMGWTLTTWDDQYNMLKVCLKTCL